MGNSKIVYYGETLIDLTGDTVEAAKLLKGVTAHDKKGEKVTGTLSDVTQATPAITVDAAGKITASATQAAGVVAAGTKSATKQLPVQAAKTVTPSASAQTAVAKGVFTTGIVTVAAVYAVIGVTYPSGSTVTCTNGSKTLKAKDTSGKAMFIIPTKGTWTVKAVKGSQSASKAVSITAEGQVKTVTLTYELYIFKSGSGLTAGYSVNGTGGNVSNDSISWSGNSESGGMYVYIEPAVALNNYTKLCVDFECSYNYGGDYGMAFGVGIDTVVGIRISWTHWTAKVTSTAQGKIARNTVQCDISALTDSEYIKIVGSYSAGKVYNIWLE
nr:MAG TPA: tail protein [Caudoviricetes sp.]